MPDLLIHGDTVRSPELRHELPLSIGDAFLYAEVDGVRHIVISSLEVPRVRKLPGPYSIHPWEEFGIDELLASGIGREPAVLELYTRAVAGIGVRSAVVPPSFPVELADRLRADGVELVVDRALFARRRRAKSEAEIEGVRRAQRGTEAALDRARAMLRAAAPSGGVLQLDGAPLTCERIKAAVRAVFLEHDLVAEDLIVSHGAQTAVGHDDGSGPIAPHEPVLLDLFPRDRASGCFTDMTRVFVWGEPPAELVEWHALCLRVLQEAIAGARAGVTGRELQFAACDLFEAAGHPTQRSKEPGTVLDHGFYHALGHGVGLEVHEDPSIGRTGDRFVVGDVLALEPGLYRPGFGGVRLEDTVLVTAAGAVNFADYPYDLEP
jgi:Xaa-Pro aminopeptidase